MLAIKEDSAVDVVAAKSAAKVLKSSQNPDQEGSGDVDLNVVKSSALENTQEATGKENTPSSVQVQEEPHDQTVNQEQKELLQQTQETLQELSALKDMKSTFNETIQKLEAARQEQSAERDVAVKMLEELEAKYRHLNMLKLQLDQMKELQQEELETAEHEIAQDTQAQVMAALRAQQLKETLDAYLEGSTENDDEEEVQVTAVTELLEDDGATAAKIVEIVESNQDDDENMDEEDEDADLVLSNGLRITAEQLKNASPEETAMIHKCLQMEKRHLELLVMRKSLEDLKSRAKELYSQKQLLSEGQADGSNQVYDIEAEIVRMSNDLQDIERHQEELSQRQGTLAVDHITTKHAHDSLDEAKQHKEETDDLIERLHAASADVPVETVDKEQNNPNVDEAEPVETSNTSAHIERSKSDMSVGPKDTVAAFHDSILTQEQTVSIDDQDQDDIDDMDENELRAYIDQQKALLSALSQQRETLQERVNVINDLKNNFGDVTMMTEEVQVEDVVADEKSDLVGSQTNWKALMENLSNQVADAQLAAFSQVENDPEKQEQYNELFSRLNDRLGELTKVQKMVDHYSCLISKQQEMARQYREVLANIEMTEEKKADDEKENSLRQSPGLNDEQDDQKVKEIPDGQPEPATLQRRDMVLKLALEFAEREMPEQDRDVFLRDVLMKLERGTYDDLQVPESLESKRQQEVDVTEAWVEKAEVAECDVSEQIQPANDNEVATENEEDLEEEDDEWDEYEDEESEVSSMNESRDEKGYNDNPYLRDLFEENKHSIYKLAADTIALNESEPYYLLRLFKSLREIDNSYLRQKLLMSLDEILEDKKQVLNDERKLSEAISNRVVTPMSKVDSSPKSKSQKLVMESPNSRAVRVLMDDLMSKLIQNEKNQSGYAA